MGNGTAHIGGLPGLFGLLEEPGRTHTQRELVLAIPELIVIAEEWCVRMVPAKFRSYQKHRPAGLSNRNLRVQSSRQTIQTLTMGHPGRKTVAVPVVLAPYAGLEPLVDR